MAGPSQLQVPESNAGEFPKNDAKGLKRDRDLWIIPEYSSFEGRQWSSADEAFEELQQFAFSCGFAIGRLRTRRDPSSGESCRVNVKCALGGRLRSRSSARGIGGRGERRRRTQCSECPFAVTIRRRRGSKSTFYLTIDNGRHSHGQQDLRRFPQARRASVTPQQCNIIEDLLSSNVNSRKILDSVDNPLLLPQDIRNIKKKRQRLQGSQRVPSEKLELLKLEGS